MCASTYRRGDCERRAKAERDRIMSLLETDAGQRLLWEWWQGCLAAAQADGPQPAATPSTDNPAAYLGMIVNDNDHTVTRNGVTVEFGRSEKAWCVFLLLFNGKGRKRRLSDIEQDGWPHSPITLNGVQQQISKARKRLEPIGVTIERDADRYFLSAEKK